MSATATARPVSAGASVKRMRAACDYCHQTKVKCSRNTPCERCEKIGFDCVYSISNRMGRPKDTRNKKTLERARQSQEARKAREENTPQQERYEVQSDDEEPASPLLAIDEITPARPSPAGTAQRLQGGNPLTILPGSPATPLAKDDFTSLLTPQSPQQSADFGIWDLNMPVNDSTASPINTPPSDQNVRSIAASYGLGQGPDLSLSDVLSPRLHRRLGSSCSNWAPQTTSSTLHDLDGEADTCDCLETQATLMPRLRAFQHKSHMTLDRGAGLTQISHAIASYQALEKCRCYSTDPALAMKDENTFEVLLLMVINLRSTIHAIRVLLRDLDSGGNDACTAHDSFCDCSSHGLRRKTQLHERVSLQFSMGAYEISQQEDRLITLLLMSRALSNLHSLVNRFIGSIRQLEEELLPSEGIPIRDQDDLFSIATPTSVATDGCCCHHGSRKTSKRQCLDNWDRSTENFNQLAQIRATMQKLSQNIKPLQAYAKTHLSKDVYAHNIGQPAGDDFSLQI